jgi:twitching motility protein PilT
VHPETIAMALVDSLLKLMSSQAADVIVIPSAEAPRLERRGEPRPLSMPPLGRDMVEAMVAELVGAPQREPLGRGESVETQYAAADGPYTVLVEPRGDGPRLTIRRVGAEDATRSSTTAPPPGAGMGAGMRAPASGSAGASPASPIEAAAPASGWAAPSAAASAPARTTTSPVAAATATTARIPSSTPATSPAASEPEAAPASPSTPAPAHAAPSHAAPSHAAPAYGFAPAPLESLREEPLLDPGALASVLAHATHERASDILLSHGSNARLRVAGEITELPGHAIDEATLRAFVAPVLSPRAQHELHHAGSADLALRVRTDGRPQRYRANLFLQQSGLAMVLRPVRADPPTLDVLNLPDELAELATLPSGLVLMTGTAGSGKSTTLVALIEHINRSAPKHVITLEDPIEYEYKHRRALVHQRQLGVHVSSFSEGLRAALRESPDVILVGEMRDHETMAAALTAAETGHLVLSTLHAADAAMALDRVIDSFPEHQQTQVRYQLAGVLRAVVTQRLLPSRVLPQRVPAIELLRVNVAVATKIREGRGHQILSEIQKGRADGMLSFEVTLAALVRRGLLAAEMAMAHSSNPQLMAEHLRMRG